MFHFFFALNLFARKPLSDHSCGALGGWVVGWLDGLVVFVSPSLRGIFGKLRNVKYL